MRGNVPCFCLCNPFAFFVAKNFNPAMITRNLPSQPGPTNPPFNGGRCVCALFMVYEMLSKQAALKAGACFETQADSQWRSLHC